MDIEGGNNNDFGEIRVQGVHKDLIDDLTKIAKHSHARLSHFVKDVLVDVRNKNTHLIKDLNT